MLRVTTRKSGLYMNLRSPFFTLVLTGLILNGASPARATSENHPPLDQLYPGYQPTVFNSTSEVKKIFDQMPLGFKSGGIVDLGRTSQCYQRAELWSYDLHRNAKTELMKVFVFYTHTYKQDYYRRHHQKFDWWFHVAPYTLVRDPSTTDFKELVLDPTFANSPLSMKDWTDLFIESHKKCAEFVSYVEFEKEVVSGPDAVFGTEHCFIVRVPASDYDPTDVEARARGEKSGYLWGSDELEQAVNYAPTATKKTWWRNRLGL